MNKILVIINCYSRPQNMPRIIRAWREQPVPVHIVVVDNRNYTGTGDWYDSTEKFPDPVLWGVNDVWRIIGNLGCPCRFYPALALYQYKYAVMADDDLVPGPMALSNLLATAFELDDEFSTIGQIGRIINTALPPNKMYNGRSCPDRTNKPVKVDMTCRAHLIKTADVPYIFTFRANILAQDYPDSSRLCGIHEDMLQSFGIQIGTRYPSYLIPKKGPEQELIGVELDKDNNGLWRQPGYFEDRNKMVNLCINAGWRPV